VAERKTGQVMVFEESRILTTATVDEEKYGAQDEGYRRDMLKPKSKAGHERCGARKDHVKYCGARRNWPSTVGRICTHA
jgi:hypothetical protein